MIHYNVVFNPISPAIEVGLTPEAVYPEIIIRGEERPVSKETLSVDWIILKSKEFFWVYSPTI